MRVRASAEPVWDRRIDELGARYDTAVLSLVAPDGFPFSVRAGLARPRRAADKDRRTACRPAARARARLRHAHDHAPDFTWQRNFQVRGDLVEDENGWAVVPVKLVGGFELPPTGAIARYRLNFRKIMRFRRIAQRELAKRAPS